MKATTGIVTVFIAAGTTWLLVLLLVDYAVGAALPDLRAREWAVALHALLWGVLCGAILVAVGRKLHPGFRLRPSLLVLGAAAAAAVASFAIAADARGSGVLDIDAIGIAVWMPYVLIVSATAAAGAMSIPNRDRGPWLLATLVSSVTLAAIATVALATDSRALSTQVALVAAIPFAIAVLIATAATGSSEPDPL